MEAINGFLRFIFSLTEVFPQFIACPYSERGRKPVLYGFRLRHSISSLITDGVNWDQYHFTLPHEGSLADHVRKELQPHGDVLVTEPVVGVLRCCRSRPAGRPDERAGVFRLHADAGGGNLCPAAGGSAEELC